MDLAVPAGEFLAVLGPTGCGKTTTLRIIAGLEQPDAGQVLIAGVPGEQLPAHARPTSTVFQNYALFPNMNVFENVAYGLRVRHKAARAIASEVEAALDMVGLAGFGKRSPRHLSGGEQQRVALARALVVRPRILLLDEPLSSIDAALRTTVQEELRRLQRELGITFILVTHDQQEALSLATQVALLEQGQVVQQGRGVDVYRRPANEFVATFLGEANLLRIESVTQFDGAGWGEDADGLVAQQSGNADIRGKSVCVRPEYVLLGEEAGNNPTRRDVTIDAVVFRGSSQRITMTTRSGQRLIAVRLGFQDSLFRAGDHVTAAWRPDDASILNGDDSPASGDRPERDQLVS
jgi:ABC-type Fe3+/spermidine/putrescine transport system ATPase subunit